MTFNSSFSRRSFLKSIAAVGLGLPYITRNLLAKPPSTTVRHASFGAGGMAWSDISEFVKLKNFELVAVADVDMKQTIELRDKFPHVRVYQDWREMLELEDRNIDSVNVSTPDHMHAVMGMAAMQLGKHVYGQKPLAHDLHEVRQLTNYARQRGLVTQMGIQIHSTSHYRTAALLVQAGAIGKVKEVHSWCPKSWGDPEPLPKANDPVPPTLDWDLWLGVCEDRPFIGNDYYHPVNWRKRLDFGTGTFGDMGCHIFDPVFTSLQLGPPSTVRSEGPPPNKWNWALDSKIEYVFAGTRFTSGNSIKVTWYDGASKPPKQVLDLLEGDEAPNTGSILVGEAGTLVIPHVARPLLYPDKKYAGLKFPDVASDDHWQQFVEACLGKIRTTANFGYAGPLTEAVLIGGVASFFPKTTLTWDSQRMEFDLPAANQHVSRPYRPEWRNPLLT
jgi:predicted dehydrogenase